MCFQSIFFNQNVGKNVKNALQYCNYCMLMNQNLKLIVTKLCELQHGREMQNKIKILAITVVQCTCRYSFSFFNKVIT